ncbi:MAG TPA: hypothetical protein VM123_14250 [archaeon]|nr:hypothetical protein [archaeon]
MISPGSIVKYYQILKSKYDGFDKKVTAALESIVEDNKSWHLDKGRFKSEESFVQKVEFGGINDDLEMNDFFACTIVVDNITSLSKAEKLLRDRFDLDERRPTKNNFTKNAPSDFCFDDIRLFLRWKDIDNPTEFKGLLFEVQLKTYLQYAWSIATHDLIYKTPNTTWAIERIAYQIKAMLEHAEIAIAKADNLSDCDSLKKKNKRFQRHEAIRNIINAYFDQQQLPSDEKRLVENIDRLIDDMQIKPKELEKILAEESNNGMGKHIKNLSPYGIIIQSLFNRKPMEMNDILTSKERDFKIALPKEIELPQNVNSSNFEKVIIIDDRVIDNLYFT